MPGTSEPDNDDCCAQPEQLMRRRWEDFHSIREGDTSTIFSQRTGIDTMDTASTIQRGSLSKRPSPDPDVQPQPLVRRTKLLGPVGDVPGAAEQSLCYIRDDGMPSSLSFPSPPSVEDEELPTQKSSSAYASISVVQEMPENLSSSSNRAEQASHMAAKGDSSSRKRLYIVLFFLVVLALVIFAALIASRKDDREHRTTPSTSLYPSAAPYTLVSQWLSPQPSSAPSSETKDIVLFHDVTTNSQTDDKVMLEGGGFDDDSTTGEAQSNNGLAELNETASSKADTSHGGPSSSVPTQNPVPMPSLR